MPAPRKLASETTSTSRVKLESDFLATLKQDILATRNKGKLTAKDGKLKFLHDACLNGVGLGLAEFQKALSQMTAITTSPERLNVLSSERREQIVERCGLFQGIWAQAQKDWQTRTPTN